MKSFFEKEIKRVFYLDERRVMMGREKINQQALAAIGVTEQVRTPFFLFHFKKNAKEDILDSEEDALEKSYLSLEKEFIDRLINV